jgi:hypothetical protein
MPLPEKSNSFIPPDKRKPLLYDYEQLANKPAIDGETLHADSTKKGLWIEDKIPYNETKTQELIDSATDYYATAEEDSASIIDDNSENAFQTWSGQKIARAIAGGGGIVWPTFPTTPGTYNVQIVIDAQGNASIVYGGVI